MTIEKVEISPDCHLEAMCWTDTYKTVSIEYVEHSPDAWYSDNNKSIDIDQSKAQEIVDFLCKHFNIQPSINLSP